MTIIIYNSLHFLRACVRQIRKHTKTPHTLLISEQGSAESFTKAKEMFGDCVYRLPPLGSGYAVDFFVRGGFVKTEWMCTLDVDAFPIHDNWLHVPVTLCKEFNINFVGVHAEIESAYGNDFFSMCQYWKVGRTSDFMELAQAGFTKWDKRDRANIDFHCNWNRGWSDDGVIAHWWEDRFLSHRKLALATLEYLDTAPSEGKYGRNTDDLVFHFALSYTSTMVGRPLEALGQAYMDWTYKIKHTDFSDDLLAEMLSKLKPLEQPIYRRLWDKGKVTSLPEDIDKRIEELKNENID
jgi:hypothetical protein